MSKAWGCCVWYLVVLAGCGSSSGGPLTGGREADADVQGDSAAFDAAADVTEATTAKDSATEGSSCLVTGADCTSTPNACCSGNCSVPAMAGEHSFCATPCASGSDCASGCCAAEANTGMLVCEPRGFCAATCAMSGAECLTTEDCCANNECVTTNGGSCAAICTTNAQCASNCCAPLSNSSVSVCSATQFCP